MMLRSIYGFGRRAFNWILNRFDHPVVVLLYHRVTTLESDPQLLAVTPSHFREHMQFLKDRFPILRFEEDWSEVKEPSVVITFDDGYSDNLLEALPILEEVGVPATFFVTTGTIGTDMEFWWDELEGLILGKWHFPSSFELKDEKYGHLWPTGSYPEREVLYNEIHPLMKKVDSDCREDWLGQLRDWAGTDVSGRASHKLLTVDELRKLAMSPLVTIGAHGVTHTPLSTQTLTLQREELAGSKEQLETWLGREVSVFSYPYGGRNDYTSESLNLCKAVGFRKAAANSPGQAHRWTDPYKVPRQLLRNWSLEVFEKKMSRFWYS
jgi:peptidoglycan/xylan/chitin deacetylase (PgdA/CDA1 family)